MNDSIIIENLGPIKHASFETKRVMVFIGPQSSGKSLIAKVMAICRDKKLIEDFLSIRFEGKIFMDQLIHIYGISDYFNRFNTSIRFQNESYYVKIEPKISVWGIVPDSEYRKLYNMIIEKTSLKEGLLKDILNLSSKIESINKSEIGGENNPLYQSYVNDLINKTSELNDIQSLENEFEKVSTPLKRYSLYIPSERNFISIFNQSISQLLKENTLLPKSLIEFAAIFNESRNALKNVKIDFLGMDYQFNETEDRVYVNNVDYVALRASSSGIQSTIPLYLVTEYKSKIETHGTTFYVEEPEQGLFPEAQNKLTYYLTEKCLQSNTTSTLHNELVITTHSPYVLSSLNNLLFAYMVTEKYPHTAERCSKVIPQKSWINPKDFAAYYVENGVIESIIDPRTGLISENRLDSASSIIMDDFDELMEIYSEENRK